MNAPGFWGQGHRQPRLRDNLSPRVFLDRIKQIFWYMDTDPLEAGIAFLMMAFSLQLLNPLYDTFGSGRAYDVMHSIAPDWMWGAVGLILSLLNLFTVVLNHRIMKIYTNFSLMVYIMFIAALIGLSNPYGTGVSTYTGLTILMMVVTVRAAKDAV